MCPQCFPSDSSSDDWQDAKALGAHQDIPVPPSGRASHCPQSQPPGQLAAQKKLGEMCVTENRAPL